MKNFINSSGALVHVEDHYADQATRAGWTPATDDDIASWKQTQEAGEHPLIAAGESALKGAVDTFTAIPRAAGAALELGVGANPVSDAVGGMTGRNALGALSVTANFLGGKGGGLEEENESATDAYLGNADARAAANPVARTVGSLAGGIVGAGPLAGASGAVEGASTRLLDGGTGAALAGATAGGAIAGGAIGLADAAEQARRQNQSLTAEHALASAGLGALLGGGLSFLSRGAAEVFSKRAAESPVAPSETTSGIAGEAEGAAGARPAKGDDIAGVAKPSPLATSGDLPDLELRTPYMIGKHGVDLPRMTEEGSFVGAGREEPDIQQELQYSQMVDTINNANRVEKVNRLLEVVPEGAHPDWVMHMTATQRRAMADFVGVPEASKTTWRALADAVADREGVSLTPSATGGEAVADAAAPNVAQVQAALPVAEASGARKAWEGLLAKLVKHVAKKAAGKIVGAALGGTVGGPVGAAAGAWMGSQVDEAIDKMMATGALDKMASRARRSAGSALNGALKIGSDATSFSLAQFGARGPTVPITMAVFRGRSANAEEAYRNRVDELQRLAANNGEMIREHVATSFGPLAADQPGAVVAATQLATNGVQFLLSKLPAAGPDPQSFTPLADRRTPNRTDINEFARIYSAVMKPRTVLADIARGMVTTAQLDAVRTVYPQWYQDQVVGQLGDKLRKRDAKGERLLPPERRVVAQISGIRAGIDSDEFAIKYGHLFAPPAAKQQQTTPAATSKGRSIGPKSKIAADSETTTTELLRNE